MSEVKTLLLTIMIVVFIFAFTGCESSIEKVEEPEITETTETVAEKEEIKEEKEDVKEIIISNEDMYGEVINNYENALKEYNFDDLDIDEKIEEKYGIKDTSLLMHLTRYSGDGVKLSKKYYDIDKNGVDELILGADNQSGVIYSFDKKTNKPVFVFALDTLERGTMVIFDNGVVFSGGSGGAASHYYEYGKISADGITYKLLENVDEEYTEDSEIPVYKDPETGKKLSYKSLDEVEEKYIYGAKQISFN